MLCSAFLTATAAFAQKSDGKLDIYWIDSEGGGSTLIVTPRGESVLIDSGNPGTRDALRIHHVAAEVAGLKQIDHIIATHWHLDHYGGHGELAKRCNAAMVRLGPVELAEDRALLRRLVE